MNAFWGDNFHATLVEEGHGGRPNWRSRTQSSGFCKKPRFLRRENGLEKRG